MLAVHLLHHEGRPEFATESRVDHLLEHIRWSPDFAERVIRYAEHNGIVRRQAGRLSLTAEGRELAQITMLD